jgi:large repetitive protein
MLHWSRSWWVIVVLFASFSAHAQLSANLAVTKTGPALTPANTDVSFDVTVINNGPDAAVNVTLTDAVPENTTFVSGTQQTGPAFNCPLPSQGSTGTITCTQASLAAGASATFTFVFHINPGVPPGTPITNTAAVTSSTPDPNPNNNSGSATTNVPAADLRVTKTGTASAQPDTDVTYVVTITNFGPQPAEDATLTDAIPPGMTFVSATQNNGPAFSCSDPGAGNEGSIICTIASLAANASAQFTFVAHVSDEALPGDIFTNVATGSTKTGDPNEEDNSAVAVTIVPGAPQANLSVSKSGPGAAGPGTDVTFTINFFNVGPDASQNVVLTDTLPSHITFGDMTFVSLGQTGQTLNCTTPAVGAGGTITCTAALYPANATTTLTVTAKVPAQTESGAEFVNTVAVTSEGTNDPSEENNAASATVIVSAVDVSVVKQGPASVIAGQNISYTINVTNAGPDVAANVVLTDVLPPALRFVSIGSNLPAVCSNPGVGNSGLVSCELEFLGINQTAQFTLIATVSPATTGSVSNTATVDTASFDTDPLDEQSTVVTPVTVSSDLGVTKTGPATVTAGQNVSYTVTVNNAGPSNAANVVVDEMPGAGLSFVSVLQTTGPAFNCTGDTCTIATFAPGASATFTFTYLVSPSATVSVTNAVHIGPETNDPSTLNNTDSETSTVTTLSDISTTKTAPATVTAGTNLTYTVVVANAGPSDASSVTFNDVLPTNTTFVSLNQSGPTTFNCTTGPTISCTAAVLPPSAPQTFTIVVAVQPSALGVSNTAFAHSPTQDSNALNNESTANTTVLTSADLSVTKTGPGIATAGNNISYTITAANAGPSNASLVVLNDTLPANTTFVSINQAGNTFACTTPAVGAPGTVTCTAASLAPGASETFTVVLAVSPAASGVISNTATIGANTSDPNTNNNTSTSNATVGAGADLSIVKAGPAAASANTNITYSITAGNGGPSNAANVVVTDVLPANTTFVSLNQVGATFNCTTPAVGANGTVTCTNASLAPAATTTFTLIVAVSPTAAGSVDNTATITSSTPDANNANNSSSVSTGIDPGATDLSITKTTGVTRAGFGAPVTYTITVTNDGPSTAFGVTVTDQIPAGTTFVSATPSQGACVGTTTVVCNLGTLLPSSSATISLTVTMPTTPATVSNTATVTAANFDTSGNNNTSTTALAVTAEIPSLSVWGLLLLALGLALVALRMQ